MYRNDEKKATADKWRGWTDFLQYGSLALIFLGIFLLEALPKEQARVVVWYWAGFTFTVATVAFIISMISVKKTSIYLKAEADRVGKLFDDAIEAAKAEEKTKRKKK